MCYIPEFFLLMCEKWCSVREDRNNWNIKTKNLFWGESSKEPREKEKENKRWKGHL